MSGCFVVVQTGGNANGLHYDIKGVYETFEDATEAQKGIEEYYKRDCIISESEWDNIKRTHRPDSERDVARMLSDAVDYYYKADKRFAPEDYRRAHDLYDLAPLEYVDIYETNYYGN